MSDLLSIDQIEQFKSILRAYQPNPTVLEQFRDSNFAVIAGPAAAGKDTLRNLLLDMAQTPYVSIISTTSRPPREGEVNGQAYHFVETSNMYHELQKGTYFEAALIHGQQISSLHIEEIKKLAPENIGLSILVITIEQDLRRQKPDMRTIFLVPPSFDIMMRRLRTERNVTDSELRRRLQAAVEELRYGITDQAYYCIVSQGKDKVRDLADDFLRGSPKDSQIDQAARMCARQLIEEIIKYLSL